MKNLLMLSLLAFMLNNCVSVKSPEQNVKKQSEAFGKKIVSQDFEGILKYTHPKLIESGGGKSVLKQKYLTNQVTNDKAGRKITEVSFSELSQILEVGSELQCTLRQITIIQMHNEKFRVKTTLIAVSEDKGKSWYFIETSTRRKEDLEKLFPGLSPELEIKETESIRI